MLDLIRPTYEFYPDYARKLVADVADEMMVAQPVPAHPMNHAAFTLGHLAWANDNGTTLLGLAPALDAKWKETCGMGAKPTSDRSAYPSKEALLDALAAAHVRLRDAVAAAPPDALAKPAPERIRHRFPTVATMLAGLMTGHYANHLGQLSAWRRAMGFPPVF
jgi:hypothetical protein